MLSIKKAQVADFFLNEAHPYSKKRSIKTAHVLGVLGGSALLVLVTGTLLENRAARDRQIAAAAQDAARQAQLDRHPEPSKTDDPSYVNLYAATPARPRGGGSAIGFREHSASQIIKGDITGGGLPMGSQLRVQLLGRVESADSNSPVSAILLEDALSPAQAVVIPKGAKVIGSGQLDPARERLQVRFHSVVFPEGSQYSLSALAMMPDGSSGLVGDFSSGKLQKHAASFLGNFVGGVAEGMKDREAAGQYGIPFEPGGLKNGVLNGIGQSSLDFAKSSSEGHGEHPGQYSGSRR